MARNLIKVTYIGGSKDLYEEYRFSDLIWRKCDGWVKMIPLAKAEICEKHPKVFSVEWPEEVDFNSKLAELEQRVLNLETMAAKNKGGRPKKEE